MTNMGNFHISKKRLCFSLIGLAIIVAMAGCGGGGGGGAPALTPAENVTILGTVDDETGNSPIAGAFCRFYDLNTKTYYSPTSSLSNGDYRMVVPPNVEGVVICHPRDLANLNLFTISSTIGMGGGEVISEEDVTPTTTVVSQKVISEGAVDKKARKEELLTSIETLGDPTLKLIATFTARLFKEMLDKRLDVNFADDRDGEGGGGNGDAGGVGGDAGDGGDFSPIANARCQFVIDNLQGKGLYNSVLAELYYYGVVNRPDLSEIAGFQLSAEELAAFRSAFNQGYGQPYFDIADSNGTYFLPIPPNVSGFVRCTPPGQEQLVLATYVPKRMVNEIIDGDVNPATTLFSTNIASNLSGDQRETKENYLNDIAGLDVQILQSSGSVTGFRLRPGTAPADESVGLVAFSATSLFNILFKNGINVDYLAAVNDLTTQKTVDSGFLNSIGVPAAQANESAAVVNSSISSEETNLGITLTEAVESSKIYVTVVDESGPLQGATVDITNDISCSGCGSTTDALGQATLSLAGIAEESINITVVVSAVNYAQKSITIPVPQFSSQDITIDLVSAPDNINPTVAFNTPTSASTHDTDSNLLNIGGTAADNIGVTQVSWTNDRGGSGICTGTTSWSKNGITLQEGQNLITVTARDAAGNTGSDTLLVTFTLIDTSNPTVTITSPNPLTTYRTNSSTLTIAGNASDNVGVTQVSWINDFGPGGTCNGTTNWSQTGIPLFSGENLITIIATDAAGNQGSDSLTVDYIPPGDIAPTISNISSRVLVPSANYCIDSSGNNFTGTIFAILFDYDDPDDGVSKGDGAIVLANGFDLTSFSDFTGDGFVGSIEGDWCQAFVTTDSVQVTMQLIDARGNASNTLTTTVTKP